MIAALAVDMPCRVIGPDVYGRDLTQMHGIVTDVDGDTVSAELVAWPGQFVRFPASSITVDDGANGHSVRSAVPASVAEPATSGVAEQRAYDSSFAAREANSGRYSASIGIPVSREGRTA